MGKITYFDKMTFQIFHSLNVYNVAEINLLSLYVEVLQFQNGMRPKSLLLFHMSYLNLIQTLAERRHRFCNSDVTVVQLGPKLFPTCEDRLHSFSPFLLLLVTQLEMTFLEICFLAAVSDDALKGKIGSIRPSHLQRSDAHRCSFAVVGTLGYSLKRIFFNTYFLLLRCVS